jgi:ATP-dependent DNA helicase DinG
MPGVSQIPRSKRTSRILDHFPFRNSLRAAQEKALQTIDRARTRGKKFVLLEMPTGTGKSAVAFCAARWASDWGMGAYILSTQKALTAQYMRDFAGVGLVELRGRASYNCKEFGTDCDTGSTLRRKDPSACASCPYKTAKDRFVSCKVGVTNLDYFLAEALYSGQLPRRSLLIIDEAHNVEQKVMGFTDFEISPFTLQKYSVPIPSIADGDIAGASRWILKEMMPAVDSFISLIAEDDLEKAESRREAENLLARMKRFARERQGWVFWNHQKKLVFRPLSAAKYARAFLFSRANMVVIMSATILDFNIFRRTLDLREADCECLALASDFPVRNRPIIYRPLGSMTFRSKRETLPRIAEAIDKLLRARPQRKGLIHTNSYEMNRILTNALIAAGHGNRIITHGPGGAEAAIERHRATPGPTVLCSPAMTEGLDLADDLSRFQVIVKVPYPVHKDPYVAARMREKGWYEWQTAMRLIQATGRSVRSAIDYAETYIVDSEFGNFRQRTRHLLPSWWLQAVIGPVERKPTIKQKPVQEEERRLF